MTSEQEDRDELLLSAMKLRPLIVAYIASIVSNFDVAEDVFQETIVVVSRKWRDFRKGTNLRAWCLSIARRKTFEWIRRRSRVSVAADEELLSVLAEDPTWQEEPGPGMVRLGALRTCIEKLSAQGKRLVRLRYGRNIRCASIGRRLRRSPNSIYVSLSRIRHQLRKCILKEEMAESAS